MVTSIGVAAEELEIHASLSGYNLLWPSSRCCAFELQLEPSGKGLVTVHVNTRGHPEEQTLSLALTATEMALLRETILKNDYFSLPSDIGPWPVHGDERRMEIRLGNRSKKVELADWPDDSVADGLGDAKRDQVRRAGEVWSAIRKLVRVKGLELP